MSTLKIGFIGLGRMGRPMVSNLQRKGFATLSFDVNPQAVAALTALGGVGATSVKEVARQSNIIFTMLAASPEVRSVVIDGIVPSSKPGTFVVDMSTIDPLVTDEVAAAIQAAGLGFIDAPVGRLATHADRGECLFIWSEPRPDHFQRVKPMLEAMGSTIHHCGPVGTCIHMKIVNNYLAIAACQLNAETLTLATRFGLDLERTIEIPNGTTANNGHLKTNFPVKALTGDVEPGFQIDLAHKDLGLALTSASAIKVAPGNGRSCARLRLSGYNCATFSNADRSWKRIDTY